ncbi:excinuclease ABC subunit UvrA [Secundilactobacillus collinoides]|uniref:UvrABC system protein A n=2 Tax=Secundilactobacillus collinoides TaxID=33960 RepID=A0A0R2B5J1_SECCO|nr:excinuclease ABC subunit UvrA [Secundilactobacillus collinoides]KRM74632.1 excinuclease ATPase subunit [Secundilactobacillus collinoides DSM 20515 = JCM 1123]KZL41463.1 excinuclease ABC subunit A [Secundilactobacillus collinoides]
MTDKTAHTLPVSIEVRDAYVHNLKHIDVDIPLNQLVAIAGVSGSGKSSLALGVLYAEGSRRYMEALSTYTQRRITQAAAAQVQSVRYLPAAVALKQRPSVPGVRSTVGTMTEVLNILRLMFSRLSSPRCPNGHQVPPTIEIAHAMAAEGDQMGRITCPTCGVQFYVPGAEDFAFNSNGACPTCGGTGSLRQIDPATLIGDPTKSINDGAVASWHLPGRNFMSFVVAQMGVRVDVPYQDLTDHEKDLVLNGEKREYQIHIPTATGKVFTMDHAVYENASNAISDTLASSTNERTLKRLDRFYKVMTCPTCHGSRFAPKLLTSLINGKNIAEVSAMTIAELNNFVGGIAPALPDEMQHLAAQLVGELTRLLQPLLELGLNYLTLDRAGESLSTGELQRIQLTKVLHSETTGVLYVLDEPSVGLHAANVDGLISVMKRLVAIGNSVVVVDHNSSIISACDYLIEIGPGAGEVGGEIVTQGPVAKVIQDPKSLIGPYLSGQAPIEIHQKTPLKTLFKKGHLQVGVSHQYNLNNVTADFPINRLTMVSGYSGAGKTTLILQSLVPAIEAQRHHQPLPSQVTTLDNHHIRQVRVINSVPVGKNVRSTVATYSGILDRIRDLYAATPEAQKKGYSASRFSYNLKAGACPMCGGTGSINLDIQYLPDIAQVCPTCEGKRYNPETLTVKWHGYNIAELLALSVTDALDVFSDEPAIETTLQVLNDMGLGYLMLGENTPALSGGEAQRLKLVTQMGRKQQGTLYVFDEPSVGLHPRDITVLLKVFDQLLANGATIITIEHDLQMIANGDYNLDLGPKGGNEGGQLLVSGTIDDLISSKKSETGRYLKKALANQKV